MRGTIVAFAWIVIGSAIGWTAARQKGFSIVRGAMAGMVLGLLSPLLFLVPHTRMRCPHCAEWILPAAKICPSCKHDLEPPSRR